MKIQTKKPKAALLRGPGFSPCSILDQGKVKQAQRRVADDYLMTQYFPVVLTT